MPKSCLDDMERYTYLFYAALAIALCLARLFDRKRPYLWFLPGTILALLLSAISPEAVPYWGELIALVGTGLICMFGLRPLWHRLLEKKETENGEEGTV